MKMLKLLGFLMAATAALAFSQGNNALTETEKTQGWALLFDGKSMRGWHHKGEIVTNSSWVLDDEAIHLSKQGGGNLYSPVTAQSFELSIDWKLKDENGNSGIWTRMMESLSEDNRSGPEIQILGKLNSEYTQDKLTVGSCYMMYHPKPGPDAWVKPAGQWNNYRIIMDGKHVEHWGNGVKMVEYEIGSADWLSRQNQAKARIKNSRYGEVHYGSVVLTDHESPVWFRNIKVRPLAGTQLKPAFPGWEIPTSIARDRFTLAPPLRSGWVAGGRAMLGPTEAILSLDGRHLGLSVPKPSRLAAGAYILRGNAGSPGTRKAAVAE
jgi:hypothetical protein